MPKKVLLKSLAIILLVSSLPIAALAFAFFAPASTALRLMNGALAIAWTTFGAYILYLLLPQWDGWLRDQRKRRRGKKVAVLTFDDGHRSGNRRPLQAAMESRLGHALACA